MVQFSPPEDLTISSLAYLLQWEGIKESTQYCRKTEGLCWAPSQCSLESSRAPMRGTFTFLRIALGLKDFPQGFCGFKDLSSSVLTHIQL